MTNLEVGGGRPSEERSQDKLPSDIGKEISREELVNRANRVLFLFAERAIPPLREAVRNGAGKQVISATQEGRPGEELIGIDQPAENILKQAIREAQLPAILVSEGTPEPTIFGNGATEKFFVYSDPFDNSSPYKRGLDIPPYTVCSIWDKDGQPIGAVIGDIKDRKAYVSMNGETFIWDLEKKILERQSFIEKENILLNDYFTFIQNKRHTTNEDTQPLQSIELEKKIQNNRNDHLRNQEQEPERIKIKRSERTTLKDSNSTLASFKGENQYSLKFNQYFTNLVKDMHPKGFVYDGGGAFIYGLLASGAIDAYVMFNEPVSEIIPGLPLALSAGCTVASVNEDGTYREFKFDPIALRENYKLYSEGTVPLFIAAATLEIRDEIIKYYMEAKKEEGEKAKSQQAKDAFIATRGREFEVFRASRENPSN